MAKYPWRRIHGGFRVNRHIGACGEDDKKHLMLQAPEDNVDILLDTHVIQVTQ